MKLAQGILAAVTAVALAISFVGVGFLVCLVPPVTHGLATVFANDPVSPYDRTQLVQMADATRDYSFGNHDRSDLYRVMYEVGCQYREAILSGGGEMPPEFPAFDLVEDPTDAKQVAAACANASELYCYSAQTVSHLDDCYSLSRTVFVILAVSAIAALAGLIACGIVGRKRLVGVALVTAGAIVLVCLVITGVLAVVNFNAFFTQFHQMFFSQGNWTFPYDSLLICSLPTEFWVGMVVVLLIVAALASILSLVVGRKLMRSR